LAEALKHNKTLQSLVLTLNGLGVEGATALRDALKYNKTLQSLVLTGNQLGAEGALVLALALEENTSLQTLLLDGNRMGDAGAQALANALKRNNTLQLLNLNNNKIGTEGAQALAQALEHNKRLRSLSLIVNREIGDAGKQALSEALQNNLALETLSFRLINPSNIAKTNKAREKIVDRWLTFCTVGCIPGLLPEAAALAKWFVDTKIPSPVNQLEINFLSYLAHKLAFETLLLAATKIPSPDEREEIKKVSGNDWLPPALTFKFKSEKGQPTPVTLPPELSHAVADMLGVTVVRRFRQN
jgi:hypothetical protein